MPHLALSPKRDLSIFRKVAMGMWRVAYDPSVYGTMEIRMEAALSYIEAFRKQTGKRLTVTHLVVKAVGRLLRELPDANAILRWNRIYLRQTIGVCVLVALTGEGPGREDLSGATLYDVDRKSLASIHDELTDKLKEVRAEQDPAMQKLRELVGKIPTIFMSPAIGLLSFLLYTLNLDLRPLGIPSDPFGSVLVTNVGALGLDMDTGFAPLVPHARVPLEIVVGKIKDAAVVEDGKVVPGKVMRLHATFDHRILDGVHAASMCRMLREWLEHPEAHLADEGI
jgi:pyruvate dehydrogenase E2 component (dihydrolipoamide acetyltransferase)